MLELDLSASLSEDFVLYFSGAKLFPGSVPLAHRYGGHQVLILLFGQNKSNSVLEKENEHRPMSKGT